MWTKLSDDFPENERVLGLSDKAFRLHIAALCACSRFLTDGEISHARLRVLKALTGATDRHVNELEASGLWEGSGPWSIHKYLEYNLSRAAYQTRREKQQEGGKLTAEKRWGDRSSYRSSKGGSYEDLHSSVPVPVPLPEQPPVRGKRPGASRREESYERLDVPADVGADEVPL